ncbi:MAG TPA: excinuclease ABC subunit UvrC [Steroidobacteraceae bacterium]|jgi:excinuclease ABC subunit C|nr:excinuclease ABC subunit UvrC [Steroidobacteraceae bacterium]
MNSEPGWAGPEGLKSLVAALPRRPGVYRMYGAEGELLYVGKARSLKDRVRSYFSPSKVEPKVHALVQQIANIEVTVTNSETEALLLEYNLIKQHRPRFNVVLRDDKSFPYIHLREDHEFPRLVFYRGARNEPGRFFGPFPNAGAVKETLQQLQKLFHIRNCRDTFFANRSRPCLQHQIGRCSAPCVGLITREAYAQDMASAVKVLEGRSSEVNAELQARMEQAAAQLNFERAAEIRDQLAALKRIQSQQIVTAEGERDVDVFAIIGEPGEYAISAMLVRGGRNLGTTSYFPRAALAEPNEALVSFVMQYYSTQEPPPEVLVNCPLDEAEAESIAQVLSERAHHKVEVRRPARGLPARWIELTAENATQGLRMRLMQRQGVEEQLASLAAELELPEIPQRIECFDISHTGGEGTVASCVVFGPEGPLKKEYRRFNITGVTPGDDYGALRQALTRRYTRIRDGEIPAPDLLLIDGGLGQIAQVHDVLVELGFDDDITLVGVAKGPDRRPGQERLFIYGAAAPRIPEAHSPASRLVQRIRDEAHRFAITGHRRKRARRYNESVLETVPGLGPAKRRALLKHFGGLQEVMKAGVADIEKVAGIGASLARNIYDHLHPGA